MDPKAIKQSAAQILTRAAHDPKKLALLYAGTATVFSLICTLLSYFLGLAASSASGLSGLALRSMLESGQVVLSLVSSLLLPFWQMGFLFAALGYSKEAPVDNRSLLEGFRRWGAVLRLNILLGLVLSGMVMVCAYIAILIFTFSPFSASLDQAMQPILNDPLVTEITDEIFYQMLPHMSWLFVLFGVALLVVGLPFYYRYRMSEFALMDGAPGALAAVQQSKLLSRNNRMGMFKLDLSFWWYYLVQVLISAIAYADAILPALGIKLPVGDGVAFWVFYILSLGIQFLFAWRFAVHYQTSFALYYKRLKETAVQPIVQTPPTEI